MLVLSFKIDQGAYIGRDMRVVVTHIDRGQVKLGFEGDSRVIVSRDSLGLESHLARQLQQDLKKAVDGSGGVG